MTLFRSKQGRGVPEPVMVAETFEAQLIEAQARNREAAALVDNALARHRGDRSKAELVDVLLDIRSALRPAPVGSEVARGRRPVPVRGRSW